MPIKDYLGIDAINFLFLFRQPNLQNKPTKATESQQQQQSKKPQVSAQTIVKSQKLIPKKIEKESTQLDFFGRVIKTPVKGEGTCSHFSPLVKWCHLLLLEYKRSQSNPHFFERANRSSIRFD